MSQQASNAARNIIVLPTRTARRPDSAPSPSGQPADAVAFTNTDRLGVSTFTSFLVHMVIILGITFAVPKLRDLEGLPTLEITLVQTASDKAPDSPEFLAQANQDGGGDSDRPDIARNPLPVREISEESSDLPATQTIPQPQVRSKQEVPDRLARTADRGEPKPDPKPDRRVAQVLPPNLGVIDPRDLREEKARLNAEISRFWEEQQRKPRRKFVNARTQEYKYAAYMDAWRAKVERIGNLNYPEEARRRNIAGSLILEVSLNPDGSLNDVFVRRSSGHKLIDDAAIRIVELAAPFAPLPPDIRAETDVLHITRTWVFNETMRTDK